MGDYRVSWYIIKFAGFQWVRVTVNGDVVVTLCEDDAIELVEDLARG